MHCWFRPRIGAWLLVPFFVFTALETMGVYTLGQYFHDQWTNFPIPKAVDDVSSKTFMITGSNVGLGFEASIHLTNMQPKALIVTSRDQDKCEQTRDSILERVAVSGVSVHALPLELGSFQNVRSFVDRFTADRNGTLDVLVANAGVYSSSYTMTQDGWEIISPSRLVVVSSFGHYFHNLKGIESWNNILVTISQRGYSDNSRYAISKLLGVIFIRELASRLPEPTPVIACTVNPGFCKSAIFRGTIGKWTSFVIDKLFFVRSTEEGSRALVHAAVASDRSMHGRYLSCCQVTEEDDFLFTPQGKAFSAKLWDETITLLSGIDGRVSKIAEKCLQVNS